MLKVLTCQRNVADLECVLTSDSGGNKHVASYGIIQYNVPAVFVFGLRQRSKNGIGHQTKKKNKVPFKQKKNKAWRGN